MSHEADDQPPRAPLRRLARGFRKRTLVTARLATKTGLRMLSKTLSPDGSAKPIDPAQAVREAQELLERLGEMKGLIMKLGQMASYLEGALPPEAQAVLSRLQAESTPMELAAVRRVVEEDLGASLGQLFDHFEAEPFAAASIGQVHRARLGGRRLAVKVQYPGIDELFRSDLRTLGALARLSFMVTPVSGGDLVAELAERMSEECDYVREAQNQRLFRRLLRPITQASVPAVIGERSARRVLSAELCEAASFAELCRTAPQRELDRAAAVIFEVCATCIFRHCVLNADPHPGNYLFGPGPLVTFLDFGCIKRFSAAFVERWKRLALILLDGDRKAFPDAILATGLVGREKGFDWDYQWDMMRYLYEPYTARKPFTFTHDYVKRSYDLLVWKNPNRFHVGLPRDWLFVNRLQWGLNSVLAHLNATGPWAELWRRAVESPTEPAA